MIPVKDIVDAVKEISEVVGADLLPLFEERLPALKTAQLPDVAGVMRETRQQAFDRAFKAQVIAAKRDQERRNQKLGG